MNEIKTNDLERISKLVCEKLKVDHQKLFTKSRKRNICFARQTSIYLIRNSTNISLKVVGAYFANRHHSTLIHSVRQIKNLIQVDTDVRELINSFECDL